MNIWLNVDDLGHKKFLPCTCFCSFRIWASCCLLVSLNAAFSTSNWWINIYFHITATWPIEWCGINYPNISSKFHLLFYIQTNCFSHNYIKFCNVFTSDNFSITHSLILAAFSSTVLASWSLICFWWKRTSLNEQTSAMFLSSWMHAAIEYLGTQRADREIEDGSGFHGNGMSLQRGGRKILNEP